MCATRSAPLTTSGRSAAAASSASSARSATTRTSAAPAWRHCPAMRSAGNRFVPGIAGDHDGKGHRGTAW